MSTDYDISFCDAAHLNSKSNFWAKRRKTGETYANIIITDKGHNFGPHWKTWFEDFIGMEMLARIRFRRDNERTYIDEAFPVRLTNTTVTEGRGIPANAFSII